MNPSPKAMCEEAFSSKSVCQKVRPLPLPPVTSRHQRHLAEVGGGRVEGNLGTDFVSAG